MTVPLGVAVTARAGLRSLAHARARAEAWGLPWFDRQEPGGLQPLLAGPVRALLVHGGRGWVLRDAQGQLGFSPGMAQLRIKRLVDGLQQPDALVRLGELGPGDAVVDATLGLGADALVCAHVVGPRGRVIGLEASVGLFHLVAEGLAASPPPPTSCAVEPRLGDARALLAQMAPGSADVVLLDAMFERPRAAGPAFELLRRHALAEPLGPELLAAARRVARRWVVVKTGRYGGELKRLGLTPEPAHRLGPLQWARLPPAR